METKLIILTAIVYLIGLGMTMESYYTLSKKDKVRSDRMITIIVCLVQFALSPLFLLIMLGIIIQRNAVNSNTAKK